MDKLKEDKLKRIMQDAGLLGSFSDNEDADEDWGHSSGSEWTPENAEKTQIEKSLSHYIPTELERSECEEDKIPLNVSNVEADISLLTGTSTSMNCLMLNPETGLFDDIATSSLNTNSEKKHIRLNAATGIFETDSGPSTENETEQTILKKGKKRKLDSMSWKKNRDKLSRIIKHTQRDIPSCRCQCKNKIKKREASKIFDKFVSYKTHTEQNIYLQGCLHEIQPVRFRPRKRMFPARNRRVFKYTVDLGNNRTTNICLNAFLAIHGIKRDRLQCKVQHKDKDIQDGRGHHESRSRSTNQETLRRVHEYISGLPTQVSHYSRSSNKHKKYLGADLSIAELHRNYSDKNFDHKISYEKFRRIFNEDFNLSFGFPRKDICNTCEKYKTDIQSAQLHKDELKKKTLNTAKELHQRKAEVFFSTITKTSNDRKSPHTLSLCYDFQKNMPLPVTNVQDEYYRRQLWLYNFGIHNLSENTASMYLYTENYAHKGPNEVLTSLNDYISNHKKATHTHLQLFCDNCFSQNKNRYLFTFLDQLCANGTFENITVMYPIPGHSMMPIDRDFALIERKRLKKEKVYGPEYYVDLIKKSKVTNKFEVVFIEKQLRKTPGTERVIKVKDYKTCYEEYIKPSIPGISVCRQVRFSKSGRPQISSTMRGKQFTSITLYRVGVSRTIRKMLEDCYEAPLAIKLAKIKDVKHLLQFVPEPEHHFYQDILKCDDNKSNEGPIAESDVEME